MTDDDLRTQLQSAVIAGGTMLVANSARIARIVSGTGWKDYTLTLIGSAISSWMKIAPRAPDGETPEDERKKAFNQALMRIVDEGEHPAIPSSKLVWLYGIVWGPNSNYYYEENPIRDGDDEYRVLSYRSARGSEYTNAFPR